MNTLYIFIQVLKFHILQLGVSVILLYPMFNSSLYHQFKFLFLNFMYLFAAINVKNILSEFDSGSMTSHTFNTNHFYIIPRCRKSVILIWLALAFPMILWWEALLVQTL